MAENTFRAIGATTFLSPLPAVLVSCRGTEPGFEYMLGIAWDFIKPRLERDRERYRETCRKRSEAALARWEKQEEDSSA